MFEKASRLKVRFETPVGLIQTEDLWDIPLLPPKGRGNNGVNLDDIAKGLNKELREDNVESFVLQKNEPDEELVVKFEVVKRIIQVRLEDQKAAEKAAENKRKKEQILAIIAKKQDEELEGKSLEELRAALDSL